MKKFIFLLLLFPFIAGAQGLLTENNYRIYDVKQGKEVKLRTIVDDMDNYDVLFFGEEHNDSVTHFLEKNMLELLYMKFGKNLVLSMEMFERDVQPVMNEYLKGFIQEKHFKRDARVWGNYKDYRPLVEFAKDKGMDLICANAASRYTNLAGRKGQKALMELPDESKNFFAPLPYDTATGAYYEKLTGIPLHGPQTATDTQVAKMNAMMGMGGFSLVTAQSLWDATMAWSINEYRQKNKASRKKKIMEVNGRFHSDEGFGVVAQLKNYNSKTRILIISTACDTSFPVIDWKNYDHNGDYIMITDPKIPKTYSDGPPKMPEATKDLKKSKPHPARHVVKRKKKKKQV